MMKVSTAELRQAVILLLNHLEQNGQSEIEIDEDYYWNVPEEFRYEIYNKPNELTIGQLTDDWFEVKKIVSKEREVFGYGLVWLSSILRRVGEKSCG